MNRASVDKLIKNEKAFRDFQIKQVETLFANLLKCKDMNKVAYVVIENAKWHFDMKRHVTLSEYIIDDLPQHLQKDYRVLTDILNAVPVGYSLQSMPYNAEQLCDSEKRHFKGTLLITDPCYIINKDTRPMPEPKETDYILDIGAYNDVVITPTCDLLNHISTKAYVPINPKVCKYSYRRDYDSICYKVALSEYKHNIEHPIFIDDWNYSGYGKNVSMFGIEQYIARDTILGDWDCTVFNNDNNRIGRFSADSGMVCVTELGEWEKYNPNINNWLFNHNDCAAVIYDFDGDVWFEVEDTSYEYRHEDDGEVEEIPDYTLQVRGEGTKDGKPFSFTTRPCFDNSYMFM